MPQYQRGRSAWSKGRLSLAGSSVSAASQPSTMASGNEPQFRLKEKLVREVYQSQDVAEGPLRLVREGAAAGNPWKKYGGRRPDRLGSGQESEADIFHRKPRKAKKEVSSSGRGSASASNRASGNRQLDDNRQFSGNDVSGADPPSPKKSSIGGSRGSKSASFRDSRQQIPLHQQQQQDGSAQQKASRGSAVSSRNDLSRMQQGSNSRRAAASLGSSGTALLLLPPPSLGPAGAADPFLDARSSSSAAAAAGGGSRDDLDDLDAAATYRSEIQLSDVEASWPASRRDSAASTTSTLASPALTHDSVAKDSEPRVMRKFGGRSSPGTPASCPFRTHTPPPPAPAPEEEEEDRQRGAPEMCRPRCPPLPPKCPKDCCPCPDLDKLPPCPEKPSLGCPKVCPEECPPLRRRRPENCDIREIMKAREEARCAAQAKLDALCGATCGQAVDQQQNGVCSQGAPCSEQQGGDSGGDDAGGQSHGSDYYEDGGQGENDNFQGSGEPSYEDECPEPDGFNPYEGLDCVFAWQQDQMRSFLQGQRQWRRGEQPATPPPRKYQALAKRERIILPDSVQQFLDGFACTDATCGRDQLSLPTFGREMDEIERNAILDIKCALQKEGASTYGIPNDVKIDFVHLLTSEVWCERSRVTLELSVLRKLLARATEEADEVERCAAANYSEMGGACDALVKEYKMIMDCLRPLKDRRRLLHHKAGAVARAVSDATRVLFNPVEWGIAALGAKRSGESPVGHMMSNLGSDLLREAYGLFGIEMAKCLNFPAKFARELHNELVAAAWASVALAEYLQLRGPHFPPIPANPTEMNCEGPMPSRKPISYQKWAVMRDSYLLYREASYFREVLVSHDFVEKEAACTFPSFPEKDKKCIFNGFVSGPYLEDNVGLWRGKWAIRNAIVNRTSANPV